LKKENLKIKKRIIEELRAREYEFETIVIRVLEDWGVTTSTP